MTEVDLVFPIIRHKPNFFMQRYLKPIPIPIFSLNSHESHLQPFKTQMRHCICSPGKPPSFVPHLMSAILSPPVAKQYQFTRGRAKVA